MAAVQGVNALTRFDLDMFANELEPLRLSEAADRLTLSIEAETRPASSVGRDTQARDHF